MGKRTEQADERRASTGRDEGETHVNLVNAPLNLRDRVQIKRTSAAQAQKMDAERAWANA